MTGEKILLVSDSPASPTGFSTSTESIAFYLANDYDVYYLGLQSQKQRDTNITLCGETRTVHELPNFPRTNKRYDFGWKSLPHWLDVIKPDVLLTTNDIQMVQHVPDILCPNEIKINIIDRPSKRMLSEEAIKQEVENQAIRFREKYPLKCRYIMYGPQDGIPPMNSWRFYYEFADQVVAMSQFGQDVYRRYYDMDVPYIYHGVDTDMFRPNRWRPDNLKGAFIIGDINRNQPRKQPVRTMMAFAKFAKDKRDALLHMQMDWRDEFGHPLDYFADLYGIRQKMINPKPVGMPREEVAQMYNMWDIHADASAGEGFGYTFIEAQACGVPVTATRYTTLQELVIQGSPSPRGILVEPETMHWDKMDVAATQRALIDIDKMADAFQEYYDDRELIQKHGENGRRWAVNTVDCRVIEPQWLSLVKDVLNKED